MMLRKCFRRCVSLGFASLIEPVQPTGSFQPNKNLYWRNLLDDVRLIPCRQFSIAPSQLLLEYQSCNQTGRPHNLIGIAVDNHVLKRWSSMSSHQPDKPSENEPKDLPENQEEEDDSNLTIFQRFKKTYKKHGKILISVHIATSAVWFGGFYYMARSGVDVVGWMEAYNFPPKIISPFRHAGLGELAIMYLLYKVATPLRYTVTLGGTNVAIRYLRRTGYIDPVKPEDSIRSLMKDSSDVWKERGSEFLEQRREKMKSSKDKDST